ncbi:TetR/AcrR family transcriptional regulator [Paractinoplanes bogorensis]|uniref:TetR/AcrR family transcriptional regulator n=1 Tax=Paractinoplanes bogorensis TaxID=1610840 RepID=UPI0027E0E2CC|nr:TetR/AcrR family transcriptional regulator [Actinoplanes bogorensis]
MLTRTQKARQQDIIAAAIVVLDTDGFANASVERVAQEAGTSKGTVLYHFKSKEGVHEAVVRLLYDNGTAYMAERIRAEKSSRDRLRAYLGSNLRFIAENAAHVRAVHRILQNAGGRIEVADGVEPLRDLLATGQQRGEFGQFDPQVVALMTRALIDAASFHFTAHPDLDVEHYVAETIRFFEKATAKEES